MSFPRYVLEGVVHSLQHCFFFVAPVLQCMDVLSPHVFSIIAVPLKSDETKYFFHVLG